MGDRVPAPLRVAILIATVLAALSVSFVAYRAADYAWNQVVGYRSPYVGNGLPAAKAGPPLSRRVVLVIVDGLTLETSRKMESLGRLREFGADLRLTVSQPSLSYPGWTTILSGAPPRVSGVTTNWWKGRVPVETLIDTALASGRRTVVVGPSALDTLYGASRADAHYYRDYDRDKKQYLSSDLVVHAVDLVRRYDPQFVVVHLPDVDEAGHDHGAASPEYLETAERTDTDISVLVQNVQDGRTTFVVVSDHGHISTGGHGGWEEQVVQVPAVLAGPGVALSRDIGRQEDLAPVVAVIAGLPVPRDSVGRVIASVPANAPSAALGIAGDERARMLAHYLDVVNGGSGDAAGREAEARALSTESDEQIQVATSMADQRRLARERTERLPLALGIALTALFVPAVVGIASWRALVAALAGAVAYYVIYLGAFFGVHRYAWSLSVVNSEDLLKAFFNGRMAEAAFAGVVAAMVAGLVYPMLRSDPKGSRGRYRIGWLSLGPATVLTAQATLGLQAAWYVWWWGLAVTWVLPDLRAGFKFDLDMLQLVALGIAALLSPVVTLLVGRYHPRVARGAGEAAAPTVQSGVSVRPSEE